MIKINGAIPNVVGVAVSGGPDSMAILDFLTRGNREVFAVHFDHGTEHGSNASKFVKEYCDKNSIKLYSSKANRERLSTESPEEYWRNMRYNFFRSLDFDIITGHTLDDQVEQWIMTSLHANPRLIPYRNRNVFRPFMTTTKDTLVSWCKRKNVPFVVDPSNFDDKYMRSFVRKNIVPQALIYNPGLYKVVKKKVISQSFT